MARRWHPEMGGSPMPPTLTEQYEQIARDLNLCGCEWCEGHWPPLTPSADVPACRDEDPAHAAVLAAAYPDPPEYAHPEDD